MKTKKEVLKEKMLKTSKVLIPLIFVLSITFGIYANIKSAQDTMAEVYDVETFWNDYLIQLPETHWLQGEDLLELMFTYKGNSGPVFGYFANAIPLRTIQFYVKKAESEFLSNFILMTDNGQVISEIQMDVGEILAINFFKRDSQQNFSIGQDPNMNYSDYQILLDKFSPAITKDYSVATFDPLTSQLSAVNTGETDFIVYTQNKLLYYKIVVKN